MNGPYKAISLFSGCGGDTLGLERAGFMVTAYSEFLKSAIATHQENFPTATLLQEPATKATDITKIPDSVFQPYAGQVQVIFAGFPCQGFSRAGKKKATDPRNQMFRQFVRVTKIVRPDFIIGENVTGLTTMKSGPNDSDPLMLDIILGAFKEIGYEMTFKVLEASDFGVPQKRKRILLVGWDTSRYPSFQAESFWASVSSWGGQQPLVKMRGFVNTHLIDAVEIEGDQVPKEFDKYAISTTDTPSGSGHPYVKLKSREKLLSCSKRISPIHSEVVDLDKPCKTIICTYDHQPRLLVGLKMENGKKFIRTFTPTELKQIQGFPESFVVTGNQKEQVVQIGNAVPPPIVHGVALPLLKLLKERRV
jgi:DNA (cytosine-5)-methyltransferase 1